jgi:tRNA pseudouridine13 synthase
MAPRIRASPDDFVVEELPLYPATGEGGHTFLFVEKKLRTTEEVARGIARQVGVSPGEIGYAGRKDRVAITRQWFSAPDVEPERARALELDGATVLEAHRHGHKLRTGHLLGNRFEIRVRGVDAALEARAQARLSEIDRIGMPNRFGGQRFGRDADNSTHARRILSGGQARMDKRKARFMLSALQAEVFNAVLAGRELGLEIVELGDVARVEESGGLFVVEDLEQEAPRAARFEISATGPIFGTKMKAPTGAVEARETAVMQALDIPIGEALKAPRGIRMRGARRTLRVRPSGLRLERSEDDLVLYFDMPAGSYATVLLAELLGEYDEGRE